MEQRLSIDVGALRQENRCHGSVGSPRVSKETPRTEDMRLGGLEPGRRGLEIMKPTGVEGWARVVAFWARIFG